MQALRIHEHGDPSVLRLDNIDPPTDPGPGEVVCRVLGVSINHLDLWVRRGMPGFPVEFPRTLGCDGTGQVTAVGAGVQHVQVGQNVVLEPGYLPSWPTERDLPLEHDDYLEPDYSVRGEHSNGFDCEFVSLPSRHVFPLPDGLNPQQAAAVPLVFLTAWGMLMERAKLTAGETILVLGGASGVGSAAIQIAKDLGSKVIATAGSKAKLDLCLALGADHAVDHSRDDWDREVRQLTNKRGANVVMEHVGPATWDRSMRCLARCGRLVTCGGTTGPKVNVMLPHLFIKNQSILGSTMGPRRALRQIFDAVAAGRYQPVVHEVLPMSEARRAHEVLEGRGVVGKLVLVPGA